MANGLRGQIFVSGGAGYLGRGILRRAHKEGWDCSFTVYSRDEEKHRVLRRRYPHVRCVLGDVTDAGRLRLAMVGHDTVIHTAALKYIPECEVNVSECIAVNVLGTRAVMDAALDAGVKQVVCISTDKAPQPVNTYGMSKALVERMVHETYRTDNPPTKFHAVRYGNVIGSTGSVWPVWKEQAAVDKELLVTDPTMTRYFMGVDAAVDTIVKATGLPDSGLLLMPYVKAANVGDLAAAVAERFGVPLRVIGPRPGEKQHEQMVGRHETSRAVKWWDGDYVVLYPPGLIVASTAPDVLYTSERPYARMSADEFITLAEDSESV